MLRVRLALVVGMLAMTVTLGIVLARAPLTVAGTNGIPAHHDITTIRYGGTICQAAGTVPAGASAASLGPGLGGCPPAARATRNGRASRVSATASTTLTGAPHFSSSGPATVIGGPHLIIPGNAARLATASYPVSASS